MAIRLRYRWKSLTTIQEVWRTGRSTPEGIASKQQARFVRLVSFARKNSLFYRQKYQHLSEQIEDIAQLPIVTKSELMANFDNWVTDKAVRIEDLEIFLSDVSRIGEEFLGRYTACYTSGSTGIRGGFIHDNNLRSVLKGLVLVRGLGSINYAQGVKPFLCEENRRLAHIIAVGSHHPTYTSTVL